MKNNNITDSQDMIMHDFQNYMNYMQNQMMSMTGINKGRLKYDSENETKDNEQKSSLFNNSERFNSEISKSQEIFENNVQTFLQKEYIICRRQSNKSLMKRFVYKIFNIGDSDFLLPLTKTQLSELSFINKVRYRVVQWFDKDKFKFDLKL